MAGMAAENHGWLDYSILLFLAAAAVVLPYLLRFAARVLRHKESEPQGADQVPSLQDERVVPLNRSMNTRYFSAVQIASAWILPLGLLISIASPATKDSSYSTLSLLTISVFMGVALIYLNRKGDLKWLDSVGSPMEGDEDTANDEGVES